MEIQLVAACSGTIAEVYVQLCDRIPPRDLLVTLAVGGERTVLVICNDDLVDRGRHKVGGDALARIVALTLDEGAMPPRYRCGILYGLQQFPCRAIARVDHHHVQVFLEVGEPIDKQAHVKWSRT